MTTILKQLSNLKQAKKLFKDANEKQISAVISTLENLKSEKVIEAQIEAEKAEQELRKLEKLKVQILDENIDFEKLTAMMSGSKRPRKARKNTSESPVMTYVFGDNETWNGEGEVPQNLQTQLDEGYKLSDFIHSQK